MKLYPDTKIYIACPGNLATGGPESLHQLCSLLIRYGFNAYMLYLPMHEFHPDNPIDENYRKYCLPYVLYIEDEPRNILIMYETVGEFYFAHKRVQKIFWWLSVDNYLSNTSHVLSDRQKNALSSPVKNTFFFFQSSESKTDHWVSSEYARLFITLNGVPKRNIHWIESYMSHVFLNGAENVDLTKKENLVAFNPRKGLHITQQLMKMDSELKWTPIQDMTPEEVQELLAKVKVYVDFGSFPGRERIPREATLSGCVVITGKRGAAANDIDVNIPPEFKFDETNEDLEKVIEKIHEVFENFETEHAKQKAFQKRTLDGKYNFEKALAEIFGVKPHTKNIPVAICQGYSRKSFNLVKLLEANNPEMTPSFLIDDWHGKDLQFDGELITYENNRNFFHVKDSKFGDMDEGVKMPIITMEEAKFLYLEGRIKKFAFLSPELEELKPLIIDFQMKHKEDIFVVNLED